MRDKYLKNVVTLTLNKENCTGCGRCMKVCPHNVFEMSENKAKIIDKDRCMECGACAKNCPFSALEVKQGVGCAAAVLTGWIFGTEPVCGCSSEEKSGCC